MTATEIRTLAKEFSEYEMREITQRKVLLNILYNTIERLRQFNDLNCDKYVEKLKEAILLVEDDMKNAESGFNPSKEIAL